MTSGLSAQLRQSTATTRSAVVLSLAALNVEVTPPLVVTKALHSKKGLVIVWAKRSALFNLYQGSFSASFAPGPHP